MTTLQEYLSGSMADDRRDLDRVEAMITEVAKTLVVSFKEFGWPYSIKRGDDIVPPTKLSQSTTAMTAVALFKALGLCSHTDHVAKFPGTKLREASRLKEIAEHASDLVVKAVISGDDVASKSGTFGANDPFSLPFLAELAMLHRTAPSSADVEWAKIDKFLRQQATIFASKGPFNQSDLFTGGDKKVVKNAVIALKAVQLIVWCSGDEELSRFGAYFEQTIHEHLSFSSIPDSRFDPAELAFALEGLLLSQHHAVDPTLFNRVIEVLAKAQQESAFWRPAKPFLADDRGMSLFPVSVEVANSLLRSCELFDRAELRAGSTANSIDLFRRYWQWLRARTMRFRLGDEDYVGWHSEHVNESGTIHVWSTSQVLEFLVGYRQILQSHVARTTLLKSGFKSELIKGAAARWSAVAADMEPTASLGPEYAVYERLGNEFINPWLAGEPRNYSLLLYGPPGTGKTTVAESIAKALSWPMITITVSDFLGAGGAEVEARAKAIFDVLLAQPRCVVLFDEIDAFLLDRDSKRYGDQDTVFQFMTPGMLTKLNDLRRSERMIFVVATNYESRIDTAIKRTGRIDQKYLVLPPDAGARRRILTKLLNDFEKDRGAAVEDTEWARLQEASIFLGYKDMEAAVKRAFEGGFTPDELMKLLAERARTTSLSSYRIKFEESGETCPYEEFFCLVAMLVEEAPSSDQRDDATLAVVAGRALQAYGTLEQAIYRLARPLTADLRLKVIDALNNARQSR